VVLDTEAPIILIENRYSENEPDQNKESELKKDNENENLQKLEVAQLEVGKIINQKNISLDLPSEEKIEKPHILSLKGKKTVGVLMLISSTIHNIMDGLALGITFASRNTSLIISTTIAITLHEIPKELGDAGILLHSDFNIWAVLFWNVIVNTLMILGAAIGLGVGQISEASKAYSLAFVAGNFFYISLAQMIPEIIKKKKLTQVILQYCFIILGMGIMFLILIIESDEEH
jgi:zinc transporter ZupT